jgi:hypothetical protein
MAARFPAILFHNYRRNLFAFPSQILIIFFPPSEVNTIFTFARLPAAKRG